LFTRHDSWDMRTKSNAMSAKLGWHEHLTELAWREWPHFFKQANRAWLSHAGGNDLSRGGIASRDSGALATLPPLLRETTRQKLQWQSIAHAARPSSRKHLRQCMLPQNPIPNILPVRQYHLFPTIASAQLISNSCLLRHLSMTK
jgi:hypothetical protein